MPYTMRPERSPDEITVTVDLGDAETECKEDNNALTTKVEPGVALADSASSLP